MDSEQSKNVDIGLDRIEFLIGNSKYLDYIPEDCNKVQFIMNLFRKFNIQFPNIVIKGKCFEESNKVFLDGIQFIPPRGCKERHLMDFISLITKSIALAPTNSIVMARSYNFLATVLLRIKNYLECLKAIECVLKCQCDESWKLGILIKRTEALYHIHPKLAQISYKEALEWIKNRVAKNEQLKIKRFLETTISLSKANISEEKVISQVVNKIPDDILYANPNMEVPSLSNSVRLQCNETYGRYYEAVKDIKAGEVIGKEEPFSRVLYSRNRYKNCWRCLQLIWNSIPCDNCINVVFCSEKCRDESWTKFHDIECEILPIILQINSAYQDNLITSMRLLILAIKEFGGISNLRKILKEVDQEEDLRLKGFSDDGKFCSNSYKSVYSLLSINKSKSHEHLKHTLVYIVSFIYYLANKTTFFGKVLYSGWTDLCKNEDVIFVGGLLFKHFRIQDINGFQVEKVLESDSIGIDISPCLSLLNHSCNPNAQTLAKTDCRILFALNPIKKGEQIFINYIRYNCSKNSRRWILQEKYMFNCSCIACINKWPNITEYSLYKDIIIDNGTKKILEMEIFKLKVYTHRVETRDFKNLKDVFNTIRKIANSLQRLHNIVESSLIIEQAKYAILKLYDKYIV